MTIFEKGEHAKQKQINNNTGKKIKRKERQREDLWKDGWGRRTSDRVPHRGSMERATPKGQ